MALRIPISGYQFEFDRPSFVEVSRSADGDLYLAVAIDDVNETYLITDDEARCLALAFDHYAT